MKKCLMTRLTWLLLFVVAGGAGGAGGTGCAPGYLNVSVEARPASATAATICLARPAGFFGSAVNFRHYDNGILVHVTKGNGLQACYLAGPGWHRLIAESDNRARLDIQVVAGQVYLVHVEPRMGPDALHLLTGARATTLSASLPLVTTRVTNKRARVPHRGVVPDRTQPVGPAGGSEH